MKKIIITAFTIGAVIASCRKDNLTPECDGSNLTYNSGIKAIIDSECATSGCHNAGSNDGDFTTYSGLQPYLNSGDFKREVLTDQSMPRNGSLSQDQLNKIQCWVDNGYPQQ